LDGHDRLWLPIKEGIMMKKMWVGFILVALLVTCSVSIYAKHDKFEGEHNKFEGEHGKSDKAHGNYQERDDAGYIIHRSATVVFSAQRAAEHGHHYYCLGPAVAHQQKARELYLNGSYREAIYHSLRARDLAFQVMEGNKEKPRHEYYRDEMEDRYNRSAPRSNELDISIDSVKIGKGDAVVHLHLGLDI
jgi:hypothetical protein